MLYLVVGSGAFCTKLFIYLKQIDKDGANPERVMQELSLIGLMPEDWGGDIPMVQVYISYL